MLFKVEHWGTDAHGICLDGKIHQTEEIDDLKDGSVKSKVALGHSTLSIIGRDKTTQPFLYCDGKLTPIHNEEMYNCLEINLSF